MAARAFFISILFTEVLRSACIPGLKDANCGIAGLNSSKFENLDNEQNEDLGIRLESVPSKNVVVWWKQHPLNCSGGSNQKVSWFRNGVKAPPCGPIRCNTSANGELLRIRTAQKHGDRKNKNYGNDKPQNPESYRCVVKNDVGALRSSPTVVQIPYLSHEFNKSPENVTVIEGEVARLYCDIESIPYPPNITWLRGKEPLSFTDKSKYFMVSPGVLYINATKQSDAGSYRCEATNKFLKGKKRRSKVAYLHVDSMIHNERERKESDLSNLLYPQILSSYRLIIGTNLTLVCASSGFPSLVIWKVTPHYQGHIGNETHLLLNSTKSIAVLTLKNVKSEHAGDYECSVTNFGKTQTQNITVEVISPPIFIKKPGSLKGCSGRSVRFMCQAQGYPTPKIYWLKDSKPLEMNARLGTYLKDDHTMELAISSTITSDSGIYQCVAANSAGEIWAAARLQISYLPQSPSVPVSLNCHAVSHDKISLSWETPSSSVDDESWITVHYATAGSKENVLPIENSSPVEIFNLEPFTNYTMYVRRWIKPAASNQSAIIQCSTAASVPTAAPKVAVNPISSTKLNVSWIPLSKNEARGYIVEYKLQWRLKDHPSTKVRNFSSDINQYILNDLIPGTNYDVRVLARTKQGWPNVTDSLLNWTSVIMPLDNTSQYPLSKLVDLDIKDVNTSTRKVEWKINEDKFKHVKNFKSWQLHYRNRAENKLSTISLAKNRTEYLFTNLEADFSYGIRLCMITSAEPELCLIKQLDSEKQVDYHALTDVEGVPASSTSVNITWSPVTSNIEHYYEICYNGVYSVDTESPVCLNTTDSKMTINYLKPYTSYQFKVRVLYNDNNNEHESPYSETIECYTDEDVPGAVGEVSWRLSNSTEVEVSWKEPSKLNGVIQNYTVSYISGPLSTPSEYWPNVTVPGNKTMAILPGLAHSSLYFVQVKAATNFGYGKSSERIIIRTGISQLKNHSVNNPDPKPNGDQSLGIIVGVSISTCCIIICLSSIYCRRKWEHTQSSRESSQSLKDRVILRNGNGCCIERTSISNNQHINTTSSTNEIELAVLCPRSPKTTNSYDRRLNGIVETCVKEPLLTPWPVNGDSKDLNITENPQYKPRISTGSNDQHAEQELDGTQTTALNYTAASSGSSLNNNLENSESLSSLEQVPSTSIPVVGPNG